MTARDILPILLFLVCAVLVSLFVTSNVVLNFLVFTLILAIAAQGWNLLGGYGEQYSFGHAAFFGIGAYTVAIMLKAGISFWLGLPAAALVCFIVGLALGFPALRVQTIYLAFATLGTEVGRVIEELWTALTAIVIA